MYRKGGFVTIVIYVIHNKCFVNWHVHVLVYRGILTNHIDIE
jgi:hypothetical protein